MSNIQELRASNIIALASCLYPADVFRKRVAYRWLTSLYTDHLAKALEYNNKTAFLFTGDSIYSDATAGLFDPVDPNELYDSAYRTFRRALSDTKVSNSVNRSIFSIDDHELIDNWEPTADENGNASKKFSHQKLLDAKIAFRRYNISQKNEPEPWRNSCDPTLWREASIFPQQEAFVMDTRTERGLRTLDTQADAKMFSDMQRDALFEWLKSFSNSDSRLPNGMSKPKVILSGSMILPRRLVIARSHNPVFSAIRSDSWDGYPRSLYEILEFIALNKIEGVIFLSGDEHIPCISRIDVSLNSSSPVRILSIHAPPMNAPLPFANAHEADFCGNEIFSMDACHGDGILTVEVASTFPPTGSGYALINMPSEFCSGDLRVCYRGDFGETNHSV